MRVAQDLCNVLLNAEADRAGFERAAKCACLMAMGLVLLGNPGDLHVKQYGALCGMHAPLFFALQLPSASRRRYGDVRACFSDHSTNPAEAACDWADVFESTVMFILEKFHPHDATLPLLLGTRNDYLCQLIWSLSSAASAAQTALQTPSAVPALSLSAAQSVAARSKLSWICAAPNVNPAGWPLFREFGDLIGNAAGIASWFDTFAKEDFDPRQFFADWMPMVFATPRKSKRIMQSKTAKPLVAAALDRSQTFETSMAATPLSALQVMREEIEKTLWKLDQMAAKWNRPGIVPSGYLKEHFDFVSSFVDTMCAVSEMSGLSHSERASHVARWPMIWPVYADALETFQPSCDQHGVTRAVFSDRAFKRSLLLCAFEVIRVAYTLTSVTFSQAYKRLDAPPVGVAIILSLYLHKETWLRGQVVKKLIMQKEKLYESEIWSGDEFYQLLGNAQSEQDFGRLLNVFRLAGAVYQDSLIASIPHGSLEIAGLEFFTSFIEKLMSVRMKSLVSAVPIFNTHPGLSHSIYEQARNFVSDLLRSEKTNMLIKNRHIDVLMLCSVLGAAQINGVGVSNFSVIMVQYRKQPQFLKSSISLVRGDADESNLSLQQFYNKLFKPAWDRLMEATDRKCPLQEITDNSVELFSPLRPRAKARVGAVAAAAGVSGTAGMVPGLAGGGGPGMPVSTTTTTALGRDRRQAMLYGSSGLARTAGATRHTAGSATPAAGAATNVNATPMKGVRR
ncbi:hypothetical protein DFJ73DRAFT_843933 [Zopfochytrium polystomum]|nr:hypothetical protein DFJ73DRAFT_843933 [Zopfochytrium polystomum]